MDAQTTGTLRSVIQRIESEYSEMPGLALTAAQVARLVAMPVRDAIGALERLVQAGVLRRSELGLYLRA